MLRAPEVKMAWGTAFLVTLIMGASVLSRGVSKMPDAMKPFVVVLAMGVTLFMLVQFLGNQFGYDRQGFRAFVLSPMDRRWILLGKNLATWPVGGAFGLLLLGLMTYWLQLSLLLIGSALLQFGTLLLLGSIAGNLLSIMVPFRVEPGSMKPTKMPALAMVAMVFCQLLFPVVMLPVFVPPLAEYLWRIGGGPDFIPVNLLLSLLLAALVAFLYLRTLGSLGQLLQSREIKILNTVTAGQE
jgi:hypothetical protein